MENTYLLNDFLALMREHPNTTAFRIRGEIVTNALFLQRIAPIINEFDAVPDQTIALVIEDELPIYAAFPAALLSGKTIVPLKSSWSEEQRHNIIADAAATICLTAQRMQYYFRMTYEDALDRIDNGLFDFVEYQKVFLLYNFDDNARLVKREICFRDLSKQSARPENIYEFFFKWNNQ